MGELIFIGAVGLGLATVIFVLDLLLTRHERKKK